MNQPPAPWSRTGRGQQERGFKLRIMLGRWLGDWFKDKPNGGASGKECATRAQPGTAGKPLQPAAALVPRDDVTAVFAICCYVTRHSVFLTAV